MALGLSACGGTAPEETPVVPEEPSADVLQSVEYTIETKDHSIRDTQGNICMEQCYDLVQVSGEGPVVEAINQDLQASYEDYLSMLPSDDEEVQMYIEMSDPSYPFYNSMEVEEMYNENGCFSLRYTSHWFAGGVANSSYTSQVYSLEDGTRQTAAEVLGVDEEALKYYVKDTVRKFIFEKNEPDMIFEDAEQTIAEEYTADRMEYYIGEGGQLWVCVQEYEIAPGSAGSFSLPCNLYLGDNQTRQDRDYAAKLASTPVWSSYLAAPSLFAEYSFSADGTCEITEAYAYSDVGNAWTGTWSADHTGLLTLELYNHNFEQTDHWTFQLVPMGETLVLIQKSESGLMYEAGPGYGITMFPERASDAWDA